MMPEKIKKEKILALITVVVLFLFVGILLYSISLNNKARTEILKTEVLQQQQERENLKKLNKISLVIASSSKITSQAYLTLALTVDGSEKILAQKNSNLILPIASLTKLMVAVVALENLKPDTEITATLDYIGQEESAFILETDKRYRVKELLANALISSDNDSTRLLASALGENNFISKMNLKAKELNLFQTNFANVTGLDPLTASAGINTSTVTDLANLLIYIRNKYPEILKLTTNPSYNFCDINNYCKIVINTDKFLTDKNFKFTIIGGKTGKTDLAGKNLILMTEILNGVFVINVVLGSADNFADTLVLINSLKIEN